MSALSPPQEVVVRKHRKRLSLVDRLDMRIVQVDRRIDQMDKQITDMRLEMRDLRLEIREQFALAEKRTDNLRQETTQQLIAIRQEATGHTNFLGVMMVFLSVMITVAVSIVSWLRH